MLVKSPGIGTCVTNRIELVGPACTAKAAISDIQIVILVIGTSSAQSSLYSDQFIYDQPAENWRYRPLRVGQFICAEAPLGLGTHVSKHLLHLLAYRKQNSVFGFVAAAKNGQNLLAVTLTRAKHAS